MLSLTQVPESINAVSHWNKYFFGCFSRSSHALPAHCVHLSQIVYYSKGEKKNIGKALRLQFMLSFIAFMPAFRGFMYVHKLASPTPSDCLLVLNSLFLFYIFLVHQTLSAVQYYKKSNGWMFGKIASEFSLFLCVFFHSTRSTTLDTVCIKIQICYCDSTKSEPEMHHCAALKATERVI